MVLFLFFSSEVLSFDLKQMCSVKPALCLVFFVVGGKWQALRVSCKSKGAQILQRKCIFCVNAQLPNVEENNWHQSEDTLANSVVP